MLRAPIHTQKSQKNANRKQKCFKRDAFEQINHARLITHMYSSLMDIVEIIM